MNEFNERKLERYLNNQLHKFMSKEREEERTKDSDNVVFEIKKNAKLAIYIMCFLFIVVLPIASIKPIFEDGDGGLLIVNIIFMSLCIFLLFAIKREKIIYKNGIFKKQGLIGKTEFIKFDDIIKAKYQQGNGNARVLLYTKNKKKLEINSYQTNFDWVLKEIKIRNIEIYNK